jgi:hypothetical protein
MLVSAPIECSSPSRWTFPRGEAALRGWRSPRPCSRRSASAVRPDTTRSSRRHHGICATFPRTARPTARSSKPWRTCSRRERRSSRVRGDGRDASPERFRCVAPHPTAPHRWPRSGSPAASPLTPRPHHLDRVAWGTVAPDASVHSPTRPVGTAASEPEVQHRRDLFRRPGRFAEQEDRNGQNPAPTVSATRPSPPLPGYFNETRRLDGTAGRTHQRGDRRHRLSRGCSTRPRVPSLVGQLASAHPGGPAGATRLWADDLPLTAHRRPPSPAQPAVITLTPPLTGARRRVGSPRFVRAGTHARSAR